MGEACGSAPAEPFPVQSGFPTPQCLARPTEKRAFSLLMDGTCWHAFTGAVSRAVRFSHHGVSFKKEASRLIQQGREPNHAVSYPASPVRH